MPDTDDSGDRIYLRHCLPGSEDLCDLILVAGQKRFPAHSQYLASHSHFIKQLILETGPFSWQHPLIIDQVLHEHSSACVLALLKGVYNLGNLFIDSPDLAWQLSKLTDQLNCPKMLRSCRDFLNQMPLCLPDNALHWLTVTAHEAELDELHAHCASKIAADFDRVAKEKRLASLPAAYLMQIMAVMSQQNSQNASQQQANKQTCQICWQSERQAFRLGRKRKLQAEEASASEQSSSDSDSEEEDTAAVADAAIPAAPSESSSSEDDSDSEEEEGLDDAVAAVADAVAAAAGDAVIAAVGGLQGEQSSSEDSESEEDSSSEDGSVPGPQVAVGNKPACEEGSSSEEESPSEDESKPGPQAASAVDDSSSEEESTDEESCDGE